jgi:transposase
LNAAYALGPPEVSSGCPWRLVPSDLPPWETIYRWFAVWRDEGRFERINDALVMADRERVGRDHDEISVVCSSIVQGGAKGRASSMKGKR